MIGDSDKKIIVKYAQKYGLSKVILFGSSVGKATAQDIDIGVRGIAPKLFFDFCWELYRDLSKPVDVIDLGEESLFNKLVEKNGLVLYG